MKSLMLNAVKICAAATPLWALLVSPALADPPRYAITDIFPIPEDRGFSAAGVVINNAGQVAVGTDEDDAFLYDDRDGSLALIEFAFVVTDINELGVVVGYDVEAPLVKLHEDGVTTVIGEFDGTFPLSFSGGINDAGEVTGIVDPPPEDFNFHPFLFTGGTMRLLDLSVDQGSCQVAEAEDINNAGQIVGSIEMPTDSGCVFEAFLHEDGETLLIGEDLSDGLTTAVKINESGQIIVQVFEEATSRLEAYLYTDGDLQRIGGDSTRAFGLNNSGWVVGRTGNDAFLFIDGELHDLNDLVTDLAGFKHLNVAFDINDSGQVTGTGDLPRANAVRGAFLLTPVDVEVQIDVRPGQKNTINLRSEGSIDVAILSTQEFDATQVDWETVTFGPGLAREVHQRSHLIDVDKDGDVDAVLHFNIRETGIRCSDEKVTLTGETFDGLAFAGTGDIIVEKCR